MATIQQIAQAVMNTPFAQNPQAAAIITAIAMAESGGNENAPGGLAWQIVSGNPGNPGDLQSQANAAWVHFSNGGGGGGPGWGIDAGFGGGTTYAGPYTTGWTTYSYIPNSSGGITLIGLGQGSYKDYLAEAQAAISSLSGSSFPIQSPLASQASATVVASTTDPIGPNGRTYNQIKGTQYLSTDEQYWFLSQTSQMFGLAGPVSTLVAPANIYPPGVAPRSWADIQHSGYYENASERIWFLYLEGKMLNDNGDVVSVNSVNPNTFIDCSSGICGYQAVYAYTEADITTQANTAPTLTSATQASTPAQPFNIFDPFTGQIIATIPSQEAASTPNNTLAMIQYSVDLAYQEAHTAPMTTTPIGLVGGGVQQAGPPPTNQLFPITAFGDAVPPTPTPARYASPLSPPIKSDGQQFSAKINFSYSGPAMTISFVSAAVFQGTIWLSNTIDVPVQASTTPVSYSADVSPGTVSQQMPSAVYSFILTGFVPGGGSLVVLSVDNLWWVIRNYTGPSPLGPSVITLSQAKTIASAVAALLQQYQFAGPLADQGYLVQEAIGYLQLLAGSIQSYQPRYSETPQDIASLLQTDYNYLSQNLLGTNLQPSDLTSLIAYLNQLQSW